LPPATTAGAGIDGAGRRRSLAGRGLADLGAVTHGVRPEYVTLEGERGEGAVPAGVTQAQDIGTYWLLTTQVGGDTGTGGVVRARLGPRQAIPKTGDTVWITLVGAHTCFYKDDVLVAEAAS
jgi:glycerol transport system ATP-binding protein